MGIRTCCLTLTTTSCKYMLYSTDRAGLDAIGQSVVLVVARANRAADARFPCAHALQAAVGIPHFGSLFMRTQCTQNEGVDRLSRVGKGFKSPEVCLCISSSLTETSIISYSLGVTADKRCAGWYGMLRANHRRRKPFLCGRDCEFPTNSSQ